MISEKRKKELIDLWDNEVDIYMKDLDIDELNFMLGRSYDFFKEEMEQLMLGNVAGTKIVDEFSYDFSDRWDINQTTILKVGKILWKFDWHFEGFEGVFENTWYDNAPKQVFHYNGKYMTSDEIINYEDSKSSSIEDRRSVFGRRLKKLRKSHKYSFAALAEELLRKYGKSIAISTLSGCENGKNYTTVENVIMFADFYNVSAGYILGDGEDSDVSDKD